MQAPQKPVSNLTVQAGVFSGSSFYAQNSTTTDNHGYYTLPLLSNWKTINEYILVPRSFPGYQIEGLNSGSTPDTYSLGGSAPGVLLPASSNSQPYEQIPYQITCPAGFSCDNANYYPYGNIYEADFAYTPMAYSISGALTQTNNTGFTSSTALSLPYVYLYFNDGSGTYTYIKNITATTAAAPGGGTEYQYSFNNLAPGDYEVSLTAPSGTLSIGSYAAINPAPPSFVNIIVGPGCSINGSTSGPTGATCQ